MSSDRSYRPQLELLESRQLLAYSPVDLASEHPFPDIEGAQLVPALIAGTADTPTGKKGDSPARRVDKNRETSLYKAVGALRITAPEGGVRCTGTLISPTHVLTAAHCFDFVDNDGDNDAFGGQFIMNITRDESHVLEFAKAADGKVKVYMHEDFDGFPTESLTDPRNRHDDVAVVELDPDTLVGDPGTYPLPHRMRTKELPAGKVVRMVGYGQSGAVDEGYTVPNSLTVKREGRNAADFFEADDEGSSAIEMFGWDYDLPFQGVPKFQGGSLGNTLETQIGGGDSGGPSFIVRDNEAILVGINTGLLIFGSPGNPLYPSLGFGMAVSGYYSDIRNVIDGEPSKLVLGGTTWDGQIGGSSTSTAMPSGGALTAAIAMVPQDVQPGLPVDGDGSFRTVADRDSESSADAHVEPDTPQSDTSFRRNAEDRLTQARLAARLRLERIAIPSGRPLVPSHGASPDEESADDFFASLAIETGSDSRLAKSL